MSRSALGKACDYLFAHRTPLTAHLEYGQTRLDNDLVENAIRPDGVVQFTICQSVPTVPR
jgi:hypothetical protein